MNKETFLAKLREYLRILEDQEQEDILAEYAQHIDMKMQKGLSEEEAIQDFGAMQELAAGILEAYHVKPEFQDNKNALALRLPKTKGGSLGKGKNFLGRAAEWMKARFLSVCRSIGSAFRWIGEKNCIFFNFLTKPFRRRKGGGTGDPDLWETQTKEEGTEKMKERTDGFFRKIGRRIVMAWKWFLAFCRGCLRLCWNLAWLMFSFVCAFMAMVVLMGFGVLFVLLFQGYPMLGIFLISLGGILCFASLSYGAFGLIIRKRDKDAMGICVGKLHKKLIAAFCFGVFLCGVGTGVGFTEFSALSYGGEYIVGATDMRTEDLDVAFGEGEGIYSIQGLYPFDRCNVQTDNSVPDSTVRFRVTYNAEHIEPYAYWDEESGRIICSFYWHGNDDEFANIIEAKDIVLQNLKEGKLVSLDRADWEEVTVLVNEADAQRVEIHY